MRLALISISLLFAVNTYADDLVLADNYELSHDVMDSSRGGQYTIDLDSVTASSEIVV